MAREAPHLLQPQHVAALQASAGNKTVQGLFGLGKKSKARAPKPLTWKDTQWADTRYLGASKEGSGGVLFAGAQGREVVVKPGESMDIEGAIATHLTTLITAMVRPLAVAERCARAHRCGSSRTFARSTPSARFTRPTCSWAMRTG